MKQTKFKETEIGMIPEDWEVKAIGDVADVIGGGTPSTKDVNNFGGDIPWITPRDLSNYQFRYIRKGERNITKEGLENSSAKLLPKETILLTTRAPIGYVAIADNEVTTNQGFRSLIPKKEAISLFLYYLLKLNTEYLKAHSSGTTFGELSGSTLKSLKFPFPSISEQTLIAKILSDLDSKIELNRQMNKTLEAIGEALFKRWFVDFEFPNEKGKPYKSSGGEMVDSELGKIPRGWKVGTFADEFNLTMGQSPPGKSYNENGEGIIFFQGRTDFGFRYPKNRMYCTSPTRFAEKDSTLLSVRAPVGDLNMTLERCCIGRGLAAIIHKSNSRSYTYYALKYNQPQLKSFDAEGTVFGSVNKDNLKKIKITIPDKGLTKKFEESIFAIDESVENNEIESETLSQIRDSLLPKLMSGKIRVPVEVRR